MDASVLAGADEAATTGRFGRAASISAPEGDADAPTTSSWRIVSSGGGPIDVAASLNPRPGEAFAFLYGVLHLTERLKGAILVGSSDGARVYVDKRVVSSADWSRPERDDEDVARVDLAAGDHAILVSSTTETLTGRCACASSTPRSRRRRAPPCGCRAPPTPTRVPSRSAWPTSTSIAVSYRRDFVPR